jgi:hypothetical protein
MRNLPGVSNLVQEIQTNNPNQQQNSQQTMESMISFSMNDWTLQSTL